VLPQLFDHDGGFDTLGLTAGRRLVQCTQQCILELLNEQVGVFEFIDEFEELARYLFVWISLLGAALSVQRRGHFGMDFFFRMLPEKGRRFLIFVIYLLMGGVIFVLLIQGIVLVQKTAAQQSPAMEISMGWAYACLPVGAALMSIHLLAILLQEAMKEKGTL
jgi:TRAP-type C4-dicarboxylate transport system permease small subunit